MVTVVRRNQSLLELFGHPEVSSGDPCRVSCYNFVVAFDDGNMLVYNTLCNAFAIVDNKTWDSLASGSFAGITKDDFDNLVNSGILVPESFDEHRTYLERFEFLQHLSQLNSGVVRYNIYTTTYCNARCPYCFESGIPRKHMDVSTADKVASYIKSSYSRTADEIYLRWFGGEPLVNTRIISHICKQVKEIGIPFYSTTSTNGLLLDKDLIKIAMSEWNLKKVRFSFDGLGDVHNKRKNFIGFKGDPFGVTLNNMDSAILAGLRVVVRLTLDLANSASLSDLATMLISRYNGCKNVALYSKCIFSEVSQDKYKSNSKDVAALLEANASLTEFLINSGMYDYERLAPAGLRTYFCAANDPYKVVISPSGELCSCECNCVKSECWGDVVHGVTNNACYEKWHCAPKIDGKCKDCPLLPVCTPYASICPSDYFSCHDRFETTMRLFMIENYRRHKNGLPLLLDSETFASYRLLTTSDIHGKEVIT